MSKSKPNPKAKKQTAAKAAMTDVAHPGTSLPPDTSKPIITHRPMIKDPMMVEGEDKAEPKPDDTLPVKRAAKLAPLSQETNKPAPDPAQPQGEAPEPEPESGPEPEPEPASEPEQAGVQSETGDSDEPEAGMEDVGADDGGRPDETTTEPGKKTKASAEEAAAKAKAEEEAKVDKLIESKKYFLPINAVEQRRSARFVAAGVVLAIILAAAWVNIALDAGLIDLGGIKPVTHLFSN